jgi:calcineurin-like phosphoesterase family protein
MTLEPENTFFTSDTHLKHKSILRYQPNRVYSDVNEMNEAIINNWNSLVPVDGVVIHHGDFAFASKSKIREYRNRLNGRIILILGNHDYYSEVVDAFGRENIFDSKIYRVGNRLIHSCHFPMASWKDAEDGSWQLHGHYHGHKVDDTQYKRMDVGIDTHPEQRPYTFAEIEKYMNARTLTPVRHPE